MSQFKNINYRVSKSIREFFACQGATRGDLLARINACILRRAWELAKIEGEAYSTYSLIRDWNEVTKGAPFTEDAVETYVRAYPSSDTGTARQQLVAKAVNAVINTMPPSCNQQGGKLNSALINIAWKLLDKIEKQDFESLKTALALEAEKVLNEKDYVKYRQPSKHKIPGQTNIQTATRETIARLKAENKAPAEKGRVNTQLAGVINAVAWKLYKLGECNSNLVYSFVAGKRMEEIKAAL